MIQGLFDIDFFNKHGYVKASIPKPIADIFLEQMKSEMYQEDTPDEPDYPGYVEKYYKDRFISSVDLNSQENRSAYKKMLVSSLLSYQRPLVRFYGHGMREDLTNVSAYEGKKGYMMDWHQDIGDRCITESLLYLSDKEWHQDHGGEFEIARVERGDDGKIVKRSTVGVIAPVHGDIVIMNNISPHFEHRARPWNGEHSRYSIITMIGLLSKH
jgi:Rps23 Pro-64 3,4-dihydroxylase Tpa1-like proline 4-hydroxylase